MTLLELVQTLLETILNSGPRAWAAHKSKKKATLGASIFRFILLGQDVVDTGNRILHLLSLMNQVSALPVTAQPPYRGTPVDGHIYIQDHWYRQMNLEINRQIDNLNDFVIQLGFFAEVCSLLDLSSVRTISERAWLKALLFKGPFDSVRSETNSFGEPLLGRQLEIPQVSSVELVRTDPFNPSTYSEINWSFLTVQYPIGEADVTRVQSQLQTGLLQSQLVEIESALEKLRSALDGEFAISEILLELSPTARSQREITRRRRGSRRFGLR
jgi:hypothetical protein